MASPYQIRQLQRALNSFCERYHLGQPHLSVNSVYTARTAALSPWCQWLLGLGAASIGRLPIDRVSWWLAHPSVFYAGHPGGYKAHRDRLAQIRGVGTGWHVDGYGVQFIAGFEGFSDHWYDDGTGTMTIGYGHTHEGDVGRTPITQAQGLALLKRDLILYENAVKAHVTRPLDAHAHDALVSFVYNLGPGVLTDDWNLAELVNAGRLGEVAQKMLAYSNPGNPVIHAGLLRRRQAEAKLLVS